MCVVDSCGCDMAMQRCRPWALRGCGVIIVICCALSDVVGVWRGVSGAWGAQGGKYIPADILRHDMAIVTILAVVGLVG